MSTYEVLRDWEVEEKTMISQSIFIDASLVYITELRHRVWDSCAHRAKCADFLKPSGRYLFTHVDLKESSARDRNADGYCQVEDPT